MPQFCPSVVSVSLPIFAKSQTIDKLPFQAHSYNHQYLPSPHRMKSNTFAQEQTRQGVS